MNDQNPERRSGWVFDKTINTPTLLALTVFAFGIFKWSAVVDTDIQTLKLENSNRKEAQIAMIQSISIMAADNKQDLREIRSEIRQALLAMNEAISKKK